MNETGVLIILVAFGGGALLASIIPGLVLGIPIGMFVLRRDVAFVISLAASVIGAFVAYLWVKNPSVSFDPIPFSVFLGAFINDYDYARRLDWSETCFRWTAGINEG